MFLGSISVTGFIPQTAKQGKEMTERKEKLRKAFVEQNELELPKVIESCKNKEKLSVKVSFNLNDKAENPTSYKKDLDNLLKVLLDVLPEEMDDSTKAEGLSIIKGNEDDRVWEIHCSKNFVHSPNEEGIVVEFYEFPKNKG